MITKRKPYINKIKSNWWKTNNFYKRYIIREFASIFQVWFSILLLFGILMLKNGNEFWIDFINFLKHPIVIIINIFTIIAAFFHSITWFNLIPKAINIVIKDKKISELTIVKILWILMILITSMILIISFIF
ncbi:fumarate reductase subunit FrdC [Candidatus Providencia siddallii]|uniref:Fumarate reductase subunit C n=1 Tax=Candidatus Providencia siddallii TaxID=1715285 RepID=A0ABP1CFM9_9GAMM